MMTTMMMMTKMMKKQMMMMMITTRKRMKRKEKTRRKRKTVKEEGGTTYARQTERRVEKKARGVGLAKEGPAHLVLAERRGVVGVREAGSSHAHPATATGVRIPVRPLLVRLYVCA